MGRRGFKIKHESYQDDLRKVLFNRLPNDDCKNYEAMEEEPLSMLHASLIMEELSRSKKGSYGTPNIRCPISRSYNGQLGCKGRYRRIIPRTRPYRRTYLAPLLLSNKKMYWRGMVGKLRLRYKLCRCGCEINDLMKEETGNFVPFILSTSCAPFLSWPPSGSHIRSLLLSLPCSAQTSASPKLPAASDPFPLDLRFPEIASEL